MAMLQHSAIEEGSYNIQRSLRFRSSASAYLNRTPASASNRTTWTWSGWVKRGALGTTTGMAYQQLFGACPASGSDATFTELVLNGNDTLQVGGWTTTWKVTTQVFRDTSAWYHFVWVLDTGNATAADRMRLYVNGSRITSFSTSNDPSLNATLGVNNNVAHALGSEQPYSSRYFDGYLAEVNFIDGQALTPSSFGQTDAVTGVWTPKKYTGTYGTNGFYLDFKDNSTTTALASDNSGNANNWTANNISLTAGATYDSMTDVPTLTSASAANYCVLNPLDNGGNSLTAANLNFAGNGSATKLTRSTFAMPTSGKWYAEFRINTTASGFPNFGIVSGSQALTGSYTGTTLQVRPKSADSNYPYWVIDNDDATKRINTTAVVPGTIFQLFYDADQAKVWMGVNNTYYGISGGSTVTVSASDIAAGTNPAYSLNSAITYFVVCAGYSSSDSGNANFGQRPFDYTPPTGFVALNTFNLPDPTIKKPNQYMDATTYTGTGSALSVTNAAGFQPDFVWVKGRSGATDHALYDAVRGVQKQLESNTTTAETTETTGLTAFNSNGFSVGALAQMNTNAATYVGWQWKAGGTAVTNTAGSITSQVSANPTAGFSVVTFTAQTSGTGTVGHGLGIAPSLFITKQRAATGSWGVYHSSIGNGKYLLLDSTAAATTSSTFWNNTSPTSSVVTFGTGYATAGTMVMYCFSEIAGFSKFGSYTGNGSTDGPFVYCGFRPKYVMIKMSSSNNDWIIHDTSRDTYNLAVAELYPNSSTSEATTGTYAGMDILSNGFKIRVSNSESNTNTATYIYAAFAESPFKYALGR